MQKLEAGTMTTSSNMSTVQGSLATWHDLIDEAYVVDEPKLHRLYN